MTSFKSGGPRPNFGVLPGERIPTPESEEHESETAWAFFSELSSRTEARYAPTAPAPLDFKAPEPFGFPETRPLGLDAPRGQSLTSRGLQRRLNVVLMEAWRENRVCPQPEKWVEFYEMLRLRSPGRPGLRAPITREAWNEVPAMGKRMCFREQVEWAQRNGCLLSAFAFIKALRQDQWHLVVDDARDQRHIPTSLSR